MNESAAEPVGCAGGLAQLRETGSTREATGIAGPFSGQYPSAQFKQTPYSLTYLWELEELGQECLFSSRKGNTNLANLN